jgi:excisionase family DNA binding protein
MGFLNKIKNMIQLEALLPIEDLSEQLGLNKYTIYQKIRKNKFPKGVKLNGRRLFKTTEIEEYLKSLNIQSKVTV